MSNSRKLRSFAGLEALEERRLLIVNGMDALVGEFPAMASIQTDDAHRCGGTLVAPDWVVTSGTCLDWLASSESSKIVLGQTKLSEAGAEEFQIAEAIAHPKLDSRYDYDLGLIRLSGESSIEPIPLLRSTDSHLIAPGTQATIAGWGQLIGTDPQRPDNLQKATVTIPEQPVRTWQTERMILAGNQDDQPGFCHGDYGGPMLVANEDGQMVLAGVAGWHRKCGDAFDPNLYSNVSKFEPFLDAYVGETGVVFDDGKYAADDAIGIVVRDVNAADIVTATITTENGDQETVSVTLVDGLGRASIPGASADASVENGSLEIVKGETITVTYSDNAGPDGNPLTVTYTAIGDVDDHGDTPQNATRFEMGEKFHGKFEIERDHDLFTFDATAGTRYRIGVEGDEFRYFTTNKILDTDGITELKPESDGPFFDSRKGMTWIAPQDGTYFLDISGGRNGRFLDSYTVSTLGMGITYPVDEFESNDAIDQATNVGSADWSADAAISHPGDVDYYRIDTRGRGELGVRIHSDSDFGNINFDMLTADGELIKSNTTKADVIALFRNITENETVVLRVYGDEGVANPYRLTVDAPADLNNDGLLDAADVNLVCKAVATGIGSARADLDRNRTVDHADMDYMINTVFNTSYGDSNLDGVFNSSDLTTVFTAGEFEDDQEANSLWEEGDWNCDHEFDSSDLVLAFQSGGYEAAASTQIDRSFVAAGANLFAPIADVDIASDQHDLPIRLDQTPLRPAAELLDGFDAWQQDLDLRDLELPVASASDELSIHDQIMADWS